MHGAHKLPEELWGHVLNFLPHEDVKSVASVSKVFRTYASPTIWRRLTVCSLMPEDIEQAKEILKNPRLARQVTYLRLRPVNWVVADGVDPWTSLWLVSSPTFWSALEHFKWSHPLLSWKYYRRSLEGIKVSTKIVHLLTQVREITVMPVFYRDKAYTPPLDTYCALWAGMRTECLQKLNLQLRTVGAIRMAAAAIGSASPKVFGSLKTILLDLGMGKDTYPQFQEDLRSILDCGRPSLRSFGITFNHTQPHYVADVVGAFGFFPNLVHFHFEASAIQYDDGLEELGQYLHPFLLKHRHTLTKLQFSKVPLLPSLFQPMFGYNHDPEPEDKAKDSTLRLEALTLGYSFSYWSDGCRLPSFKRFADTLTCLVLDPSGEGDGGLGYEDVKFVIESLRQSTGTVGLTRLWVHVFALSPELLDLIAGSLTALKGLKLCCKILVGDRHQEVDDQNSFFEKMDSRSYHHWVLQYLDIKCTNGPDRISADYLKHIIPSLKVIGTFDWEDVELRIGPWY